MGKSEHASFIGKLNLHLIKKQIKQRRKSQNGGKQNENSEKEEKEKKNFWWRWLRFVRGRSFRRGGAQRDKKSKPASPPADLPSSLASGDRLRHAEAKARGRRGPKSVSRRSSRSSQAPTPQQTPSVPSVRSDGVKVVPSTVASLDVGNSEGGRPEVCGENGEVVQERANSNKEGSTSEPKCEERPKPEDKLFTCSPCDCEQPENVIEIAVTFEAGQADATGGSKTRDEIKYIRIKEKRGSYKNLRKPSNHSLKTLKSISEPAWNEKYRIIQQQELKENLKDLLQQFLILESRVEAVCSDSLSKTAETDSEVLFDADSTLSSETINQVSPEVLVNVKPFKMFISEGYLSSEDASTYAPCAKYRAKNEGQEGKKRSHKRMEILSGTPEKKKGAPCLFFNRFSVINELEKVEGNCYRDRIRSPPLKELEPYFAGLENHEKEALAESRVVRKLPGNPFWASQKGQKPSGDGRREEESGRHRRDPSAPSRAEDVDEVLDSLDDSDHDVIFRKNLSQFRKKIVPPVKPDCLQKSVVRGRKRKGKFVRSEDILEEVIQEACDLEDVPSGLENKMMDVFRFEYSQVWKHRVCCGKTFGTFFLALLEGGLVARSRGVRTEWGTVDALQTAKVLAEQQKEKVPFEVVENFKVGDLPTRVLSGIKAYEAITTLMSLGLEGGSSASILHEPVRLYSSGTESFYVIPENLFEEFARKSDANLKLLNAHRTSRFYFESSGAIEKNRSEGDGEMELKLGSRKREVVKFAQSCAAPRMIVQMLYCPASDCTAVFCDKFAFPGLPPPRSRSEPNIRNRIEPKTRTPVTITWAPNKRKTCPGHERSAETPVGSELRLDGFQVIYNNSRDSLNDEEDDAAKPAFSGTEKHDFLFPVKPCLLDELKKPCSPCNELSVPGNCLGPDSKKLKFKSNSSPEECVNQAEFGLHEHRPRRSLNLSRELEKDVECYRRKRLAMDKTAPGAEETLRRFLFAEELRSLLESEWKGMEQNAASEKSEASIRKEISAAFDSLKEISLSKTEQRKSGSGRMSLVIVLSKK